MKHQRRIPLADMNSNSTRVASRKALSSRSNENNRKLQQLKTGFRAVDIKLVLIFLNGLTISGDIEFDEMLEILYVRR